MAGKSVTAGSGANPAAIGLDPTTAAYATTDSYVEVPGSRIDAQQARLIGYTVAAANKGATVQFCAACLADYSDLVVLDTMAIASGANRVFPASAAAPDSATNPQVQANFPYYMLKAKSTSAGQSADLTHNWFAK